MIYFRTCAYNAEKTLKRAVESVLNQTCGDFIYYILDNGSTDKTGEMIREYAQRDKRIVPFYNKRNRDFSENTEFWNITRELEEDDYFVILDADDYYEVTFLEEMLSFLKENQLDIAVCGTRFIDAASGAALEDRKLPQNYILNDKASFDQDFPKIHWYLRTVWGKVYSAKAAKAKYEIDLPEWFPKAYGGDTLSVYESVKASERIGVYAKVLHSYAISNKSVSYRWIDGREESDVILFEKSVELLENKCGTVSLQNLNFLYTVYMHAISDTLRVLFNAELDTKKKIDITKKMLMHTLTKKMILLSSVATAEEKKNLLGFAVSKTLELQAKIPEESFSDVYQILKFVNADFSKWIGCAELGWYLYNCPIVLYKIIFNDFKQAMNHLIVYVVSIKDLKDSAEFPFLLGQNIAAFLEEEDKYVFFSKKRMYWQLANRHLEKAAQELEEWIQILPEDEEINKLYSMLSKHD